MSAQIFYNNSSSSSEIITHLVNSTDGAGLHFNGTSGNIDIASPPDLGTKFSFEFIIQADGWPPTSGTHAYLVDFSNGGRFIFGTSTSDVANNLAIHSVSGWASFGVKVLDDLKVHHLVMTVDGTAATLYDNGNQVGTATITSPNIDSCSDAAIGSSGGGQYFNGTFYRCRFWNKTLSSTDVTSVYESASIDFADQWGSQTSLVDAAASVFTSGVYSWVKDGSNTIANVSNTLAITYVNSASGAYNYLRNAADLTTDLTVGKKYRLTVDAKYAGGSSGSRLRLNDGANNFYSANLTTSLVNYTFEFTARLTAVAPYIQLDAMSSSNVVTIDNWYVRAIGVSADFDLAYANPTQSTIVQNRSGSGDGTAAGGVSQISPIEQLNSRAIAVGTTQSAPADGQVYINGPSGADGFVHENANGVKLVTQSNTTTGYLGTKSNHPLKLIVNNDGKVTIDSAGLATFSSGIASSSLLNSVDTSLTILGGGSATNNGANLTMYGGSASSGAGSFRFRNGTAITAEIASTGLATFSAGIAFSGQTDAAGMTATTLNHYEEGTWTPVYSSGSGAFATMTMDYVGTPTYTRIGRQVTVTALFRTNNVDATGASGSLMVSGLPFPAAAANFSAVAIGWGSGFASDTPISGYTYGGTANISLVERSAVDGNVTDCAVDSLTTGASAASNTIYLSATYFA